MKYISKILLGGISLLVFLSCQNHNDDQKNEVFIKDLISDQSSKIWIIDEQIVEDEVISPQDRNEKMAISFYDDGMFFMQNMFDLAFIGPMQGTYKVEGDTLLLQLSTLNKPQKFRVTHANKDSIVFLNKAENGMINMKMRLIPFDHPKQKPDQQTPADENIDISVN